MPNNAGQFPTLGLVLSGGGARGAYEAGVIRYIRDELPPKVSAKIKFDIMCGTSAGAINSCFLASCAHTPELQGKALAELWQSVRIETIFKIGWRELLKLPRFLLGSRGRGEIDEMVGQGRLGGLFNTYPLEKFVRRMMDWNSIKSNLQAGHLQAIAVNATHIGTGITHLFVQSNQPHVPPSTNPQIKTHWVDLTPNHVLASAAMPWVFPAVEIDGEIYCDGALKLNTPISPALRLGAQRLFVIGLKTTQTPVQSPLKIASYPSAIFLLGKILNALLVDKAEYDLLQLERFNNFLDAGTTKFGEHFVSELGDEIVKLGGRPFRRVESMVVRPSVDISTIAEHHLSLGAIAARAGGIVGPILKRMGESSQGQTKDLLSYLLFDGDFATDLIKLGMHDADASRQKLINFFDI